MKVLLTQKSLAAALDAARRVVEKKGTIPILSNVRLDASTSSLAIRATDLDREISLSVDAEVTGEGATTVPAHLLSDIVKKLPAGAEVTLAVDGEGREMTISSGRSRFRLQCLPAGDFPDIRRTKPTHSFTLTGDQVRGLFGRTAFAMSTEETRYYLNGVFLHRGYENVPSDRLTAVGTDGHRLAKIEILAPEGSVGMPGIIVPYRAVEEVLKIVGKRNDEITVRLSSEAIEFSIGETVLYSKLIDGNFPDYGRVIPVNNAHTLRIDRGALASAVDRVSTVSSEKERSTRGIKFELGTELIRLSMSAPDAGTATEEIDCAFDGQPFEIGFNAKYLGGILDQFGSETVECSLADPGSPTILRDPDDAGCICVLMPMRV